MPNDDLEIEHSDDDKIVPSIPWYQKLLLKISPRLFMKLWARKMEIDYKKVDAAVKLFSDCKRIDIQPLSGASGRGFIIYLDKKLSLWFFQDGDHFMFDGVEVGEYDNGDVTVFDGLK